MPKIDGFTFAQQIKNNPLTSTIPIIFLTSNNDKASILKAKSLGIDYLHKPTDPAKLRHRVHQALIRSEVQHFTQLHAHATTILDEFFSKKQSVDLNALDVWSTQAIEMVKARGLHPKHFLDHLPQSYNDATHNVNVGMLALLLGQTLHFTHHQQCDLVMAAVMHDIGKITIATSILNKTSALSWNEYVIVQKHALDGVEQAKKAGVKKGSILDAILYHHEKLDGSGYPSGLKGNQIPLFAQVIGVCDVFDALTTQRSFRERYSSYDALMLMLHEMPNQLNQHYVQTLISLLH